MRYLNVCHLLGGGQEMPKSQISVENRDVETVAAVACAQKMTVLLPLI